MFKRENAAIIYVCLYLSILSLYRTVTVVEELSLSLSLSLSLFLSPPSLSLSLYIYIYIYIYQFRSTLIYLSSDLPLYLN